MSKSTALTNSPFRSEFTLGREHQQLVYPKPTFICFSITSTLQYLAGVIYRMGYCFVLSISKVKCLPCDRA